MRYPTVDQSGSYALWEMTIAIPTINAITNSMDIEMIELAR